MFSSVGEYTTAHVSYTTSLVGETELAVHRIAEPSDGFADELDDRAAHLRALAQTSPTTDRLAERYETRAQLHRAALAARRRAL
jgi:hypothetical protein